MSVFDVPGIPLPQKGAASGVVAMSSGGFPTDSTGGEIDSRSTLNWLGIVVDARRYPGIDYTGTTDMFALVQSILNSAADGQTIYFLPGTLLKVGTDAWRNAAGKSVNIVLNNTKILRGADYTAFSFTAGFETPYNVSAISTSVPSEASSSYRLGTTLTVGAATGFKRGDKLRIFADDIIPESRLTGTTITDSITFSTSGNLITTGTTPHGAVVGGVVGFFNTTNSSSMIAGTVIPGLKYYVQSVPSSTTMTIAELATPTTAKTLTAAGTATSVLVSSSFSRVGQDLEVYTSDSTTVTVMEDLRDTYSINVRVARRLTNTCTITGGVFDVIDTAIDGSSAPYTSNTIAFVGMHAPVVRNVQIVRASNPGIQFVGCTKYRVDNLEVAYGLNDANGNLGYGARTGYGISDVSSSYGLTTACRFGLVRHGFTDDTNRIAANGSSPQLYGRSSNNEVTDSIGNGCSNSAWDTHHSSENMTFTNCQAINTRTGVGLRGRYASVFDLKTTDVSIPVWPITEVGTTGRSYGHNIDGVHAVRPDRVAVWFQFFGETQEMQPSTVKNVTATYAKGRALVVQRATVNVDGITAYYQSTLDTGLVYENASTIDHYSVWAYLSTVYVKNMVFDYTLLTSPSTSSSSVFGSKSSQIAGDGIRVVTASDAGTYLVRGCDADSGSVVGVQGVEFTYRPSFVFSGASASSFFDWKSVNTTDNSAWVALTGTAITTVTIPSNALTVASAGRTRAPVVTIAADPSGTDRTLGALPAGLFRGQRLIVKNTGTANTVTVTHSTTNGGGSRVHFMNATTRVLTSGQAVQLEWSSEFSGMWVDMTYV